MPHRIAIFGAGSIGCYVGASLIARGAEVTLIGRDAVRTELARHGLTIVERGKPGIALAGVHVVTSPEALADADLIFLAMKLRDIDEAAAALEQCARPDALVVTLQNGIGVDGRVRHRLSDRTIVPGIVGFNVAPLGNGRWAKASAGDIYVERNPRLDDLGFVQVADMRPVQWGKLLLNLANAVNALSGVPLAVCLRQAGYRRVLAASLREALAACAAAGIRPARLGPVSPHLMVLGMGAPDWLFNTVLLPRYGISDDARLSMSADYDTGRRTEIDDLNGAVVALATVHGLAAPVNAKLVELVATGHGKHWSASELVAAAEV